MTFAEATQINNFKAHRDSLNNEIASLSKKLADLIDQTKKEQRKYNNQVVLSFDLSNKVKDLNSQINEKLHALNLIKSNISKLEKEFEEKEQVLEMNHEMHSMECKKEIDDLKAFAKLLKEGVEVLKEQRDDLLGKYTFEKKELDKNLKDMHDEIQSKSHAFDLKIKEIGEREQKLAVREAVVSKKIDEVIELEKKCLAREKELQEISQKMDAREHIVQTKERDAEIIVTRVKGIYSELYPDKELKI